MSTTFQPQGALATVSGDRPRPALRAPRGAMPNSIDAAGLRQILSVVPEAIVLVSRAGEVLLVNDNAVELFGRPESDLVGELIGFSVEDGHMSEVEILHGEGIRTAELRVASVEWNGEPAHIASFRDVTQIRAQEADLRRAHKMEALGRVAGGVAHDFNNLLFAIMTYANVVRDSLSDQDPRRDDLEQILATTRQSRELIGKLLAFARGRPSTPVVIDAGPAVRAITATLGPTLPHSIRFTADIAEDAWKVSIDPVELDQLLINMMVNARDAMADGGELVVSVDNVVAKDPRTELAADYVRIRVRDTGCGIDPRIAEKIYEPFFTTKSLHVGTGLGLAACHGIVRDAHGLITFESALGVGTEFTILFPRVVVAKAEDATPEPPRADALPPAERVILLVEDDRVVRAAIGRALRGRGFRVFEAAGAEPALALLPTLDRCDLVLSDVRMPGEDGVWLAQRIREGWPEMPVVLMSGYVPEMAMERLTREGVGAILPKPFALDALLARIGEELAAAAR